MKINLKDKSVLILIAVNIFPVVGVLLLDWSYLNVIFLYIIETIVIGLFNIPKMILADGSLPQTNRKSPDLSASITKQPIPNEKLPGCLKVFLVPFFLVHYNFFILVQLIFIGTISDFTGEKEPAVQDFLNYDFLIAIALIIASHSYSFYKNYIKKEEYKKTTIIKLMFLPYKRIFIQQITVIGGWFMIYTLNAPIVFMLILILLKTIFDLLSHYKIHNAFSVLEHK